VRDLDNMHEVLSWIINSIVRKKNIEYIPKHKFKIIKREQTHNIQVNVIQQLALERRGAGYTTTCQTSYTINLLLAVGKEVL
jgi:hypothetical protein